MRFHEVPIGFMKCHESAMRFNAQCHEVSLTFMERHQSALRFHGVR